MAANPIFISYRRDDTAGYARALYDALAARFGAERIFMDVDDIGAGQPFAEVLRRAVDGSSVLLVLIGPRWRGERPGQVARVDEPGDFVRLEVAAALAGAGRVIPLLVDGTPMPDAARLPADLQPLAGRNALGLANANFGADVERLVAALRDDVPVGAAPRGRRLAAALLAIGAFAAGALWWTTLRPPTNAAGVSAAFPAPAAPGVAAVPAAPSATTAGPAPPATAATNASAAAAAPAPRPPVDGEWTAQVRYDWSNADRTERFSFGGSGDELHGSASFLGVPRGVLEGRLTSDGLRFVTRTIEMPGPVELVHRYRARFASADELRIVMQTEGGASARAPVEFVARRVAAESAAR